MPRSPGMKRPGHKGKAKALNNFAGRLNFRPLAVTYIIGGKYRRPPSHMETLMDDENIAAVVACLYMACAYAGGQQWLDRANTVLDSYSADPEMPPQAAEMLAVIATAMRAANNAPPECHCRWSKRFAGDRESPLYKNQIRPETPRAANPAAGAIGAEANRECAAPPSTAALTT